IVPFIPQAGSGTRSFWQSTIGSFGPSVTDSYTAGGTSHDVQPNDGTVTTQVPNAIVPVSVASWLGQSRSAELEGHYGTVVKDRRFGAVLGSVSGVTPTVMAHGVQYLNTEFPILRPVFTVVQHAELTSSPVLAALFEGDGGLAYTATRPGTVDQLVITDFGFGDLTGGVTIYNVTYHPGDATSFRTN
ncbi:hypothetical protein, partial [Microbacterium album]|uniref:hypothetical protein n=1 Tax=Microbacterium album TaxID=2053191 RepID=UPI001E357095